MPVGPAGRQSGAMSSLSVAFIQARAVDESLALCDVAGELLARGHRPRVLLDHHERDLSGSLCAIGPDLVIVQAAILAEPWLRDVLRRLPTAVPRLLVGTGVTFDPTVLLRVHADEERRGIPQRLRPGALRGELDDALPALVEALGRGHFRDVLPSVAGALVVESGSLAGGRPGDDSGTISSTPLGPQPLFTGRALPLRGLYFDRYPFMGRFPWKRFAASRGCVHACGYCYARPLRDLHQGGLRHVRRKSVDRVIAEALAVRGRWPIRVAHFADDLFASSVPWLEEFAARWPGEIGLPFSANTSAETLSERAVTLLARAGARLIGVGLEAGVADVRAGALGRSTPDHLIRAAVRRLQGAGIQVQTFNMVGAPGETFDQSLQTLRMNQELGVDRVRATIAWPMVGSAMHAEAEARRPLPADVVDGRKDRMRAVCVDDEAGAFESLAALFRLGTVARIPPRLVGAVARRVPVGALRPLSLFDGFQELRWSGVGVPAGLAYGVRAGRPLHRVTYHAAIP